MPDSARDVRGLLPAFAEGDDGMTATGCDDFRRDLAESARAADDESALSGKGLSSQACRDRLHIGLRRRMRASKGVDPTDQTGAGDVDLHRSKT